MSIPVFAGRGLRGINTYQSDGELHIPVLHDEGVTIYDPINLVLTCSGKGWEKEGYDEGQYLEKDPETNGHLTTFSL